MTRGFTGEEFDDDGDCPDCGYPWLACICKIDDEIPTSEDEI